MTSTINLLRLLADPTRLRLLLLLEEEELSVAELQQILNMGQSRISSHLAQLKRAGVVAGRPAGQSGRSAAVKRQCPSRAFKADLASRDQTGPGRAGRPPHLKKELPGSRAPPVESTLRKSAATL